MRGEVSEPAEGARLLSEYTGLNLYREFKSLPHRQNLRKPPSYNDVARRFFWWAFGRSSAGRGEQAIEALQLSLGLFNVLTLDQLSNANGQRQNNPKQKNVTHAGDFVQQDKCLVVFALKEH